MDKIPLLLMFLGHVCVDTSQGILPIVVAKLKELFGLNYFQVGLMMMVLNLTSSVIQPIFGYISDKVSTGWFVPVGILWTALAMGLLGWSPNYYTAILLVGFAGLGTAAFHPRAMMAVHHVSGNRQGFGAAVFSTGGNLGFALGPLVGTFLVLSFGLHATVGLIPMAAVLFFVIYFYPSDFLKPSQAGKKGLNNVSDTTSNLIPWIPLIALCLVVTLRSWAYVSFITYFPLFFQSQDLPLKTGGLILTLFLASGAAAGLFGGHISDKVGRRRIIVVSLLFYPIVTSMMILSEGPWLWFFAGASGAALLASFSVTIVLAQELLPGYVGLASGLILGLGFGTGGLGTAMSGFLADKFGLYQTMWVLATVPMIGAILPAFIRVPKKDSTE